MVAGVLATAGAGLLLAVGGALSEIGRAALSASGTSVDAPLVPLQEVLMETARGSETSGAELFVAFLAALVIVFLSLAIYFVLAMRPVLLAAVIVFLPVAHALSVWTPLRRVQLRVWSVAFAVLVADAAILTMFAVANSAMGQPAGVDRLIFGTFGLLLAALSPAALARVVGAPELHTAVQSMSRGSRMLAVGAGAMALRGGASAVQGAAVSASGRSAEGSGRARHGRRRRHRDGRRRARWRDRWWGRPARTIRRRVGDGSGGGGSRSGPHGGANAASSARPTTSRNPATTSAVSSGQPGADRAAASSGNTQPGSGSALQPAGAAGRPPGVRPPESAAAPAGRASGREAGRSGAAAGSGWSSALEAAGTERPRG